MKTRRLADLLIYGGMALLPAGLHGADPELARQVLAVKEAMALNNAALRQYTWKENTEVLIKGDVKSSSVSICRYDGWGEVQKKPLTPSTEPDDAALAKSKRPRNRKKAEMQDYIERAVSLVHTYLPPKPDRVSFLLQNGDATLVRTPGGASEIQFRKYWKEGDLLTFTFDPQSKVLLKASVKSYLASEKDPVTLEALFTALPDGTNHLASAVLTGEAKKIQVKTTNVSYEKLANP